MFESARHCILSHRSKDSPDPCPQGASSSEGVTGDCTATNNVVVFKALVVWGALKLCEVGIMMMMMMMMMPVLQMRKLSNNKVK